MKAADAVFLKVKLDWDDGRAEYDVEFYGSIRSSDRDCDDFDLWYNNSDHHTSGSEDVITADKAREIALDRAPSGTTVIKCELDRDDGRWVYELELRNGRTEYECDINAVTGVILDWEADYD